MLDQAIGYLSDLLGCFEICPATLHQVRYPGHAAMGMGTETEPAGGGIGLALCHHAVMMMMPAWRRNGWVR